MTPPCPPALRQCHVQIRYEYEAQRKYGIRKGRRIAKLRSQLKELDHYIDGYEDDTPEIVAIDATGREKPILTHHVARLEEEKRQVLTELGQLTGKPLVGKAQLNTGGLTWAVTASQPV